MTPAQHPLDGHHEEGDLYYMKARFYDQGLGRFAQADTACPEQRRRMPEPTNPQALNRYAYVVTFRTVHQTFEWTEPVPSAC